MKTKKVDQSEGSDHRFCRDGETQNVEEKMRREKVRGVERSLQRVLVVSPSILHYPRCCIACISLHDAVFFIGISELFIIAFLALYFTPVVLNDGYFFYTSELEGHGRELAHFFVVAFSISLVAVVLLLFGAICRRSLLLVPHIFWQMGVLVCLFSLIYSVACRASIDDYRIAPRKIPLPSAVVIIVMLLSSAAIHAWWTAIVLEAAFRLHKDRQKTSINRDDNCDSLQV